MSRLITVAIECKTDSVRQAFEETFSRKPGYIVSQAQQAGAADILILEVDEANPQRTFSSIRSTVSAASQTEIFLTAGRADTQIMLEAFPSTSPTPSSCSAWSCSCWASLQHERAPS